MRIVEISPSKVDFFFFFFPKIAFWSEWISYCVFLVSSSVCGCRLILHRFYFLVSCRRFFCRKGWHCGAGVKFCLLRIELICIRSIPGMFCLTVLLPRGCCGAHTCLSSMSMWQLVGFFIIVIFCFCNWDSLLGRKRAMFLNRVGPSSNPLFGPGLFYTV